MKSLLKVTIISSLLIFGSCANQEKKSCCNKGSAKSKCSLKKKSCNKSAKKSDCKGKCNVNS